MPVAHASFLMRPNNFFGGNPALDVPPTSAERSESCEREGHHHS